MGRKRKKQAEGGAGYRNSAQQVRVGVAWYTSEQWREVRSLATDPELLEGSYEDWVSMAEDALKQIAAAGVLPEKVYLDAAEFAQWCRANGKLNEASARAQYASVLLHEKYQEDNG